MHYSNSVNHKFKMNTSVKKFYKMHSTGQTIWNYPYWNISKTIIYPNARRGDVVSIKVKVVFNGNTSQWFSEMSEMMYNWGPKQKVW